VPPTSSPSALAAAGGKEPHHRLLFGLLAVLVEAVAPSTTASITATPSAIDVPLANRNVLTSMPFVTCPLPSL
jgi:hypothetical protein